MVQLTDEALVWDYVLRLASPRLSRQRLDVAATAFLLQPPPGVEVALARDGLRQRRFKLDHKLIVELLGAAPKKVQWTIVRSPAFALLPKGVFRREFQRLWNRRRRDPSWRWVLGRALHPFLMANPGEGRLYAEPVWTMVGDPDEPISLAGLSSTQFLGNALTAEQAERLVALTRHESERAIAAKSSIGGLYKDFSNLRPSVRAMLRRPETIETLSVRHPLDGTDRWSAHAWCRSNMRKALRGTSRRRR
jgi:hypothetical protein